MDQTQKIISLAKRRGFITPSSEIYGGLNGVYDFGYLGVELKNNLKELWRKEMLYHHQHIFGFDAAILMSKKVWQASGHLGAGFADNLVECKNCHKRFKKDEIKGNNCPVCGGELTLPKKFNLMMHVSLGAVEDNGSEAYLRPETCQGIFVNFKSILNTTRTKIPFGVAQIGKSFRNEINPKNFVFRMREFEQMEMEWFCKPEDADKFFDYWEKERLKWYSNLGIRKENIKAEEIPQSERAHYARRQVDILYHFPFGWKEIEGIHNRGDWDLSNHSKFSGEDLSYFDEETNQRYFPHIIETSVGVERALFAFLCESYQEISGGRSGSGKPTSKAEILLKLPKKLSPIKVAVLPLVKNKEDLTKKAEEIYMLLKPHFASQYDTLGSIGRRYRRQDEIGTPFCVTVDFDTLNNNDVTLRDRDTMAQERVKIKDLIKILDEKLSSER